MPNSINVGSSTSILKFVFVFVTLCYKIKLKQMAEREDYYSHKL